MSSFNGNVRFHLTIRELLRRVSLINSAGFNSDGKGGGEGMNFPTCDYSIIRGHLSLSLSLSLSHINKSTVPNTLHLITFYTNK